MSTIRKAVIPVAGPGLSLLPATRAIPKALLPIVDKPLAEFVVDEAVAAGIEQIIFVTARHDVTIEDHFANWHSPRAKRVTFASVRQFEAHGVARAIGCVEPLLDGEPFALVDHARAHVELRRCCDAFLRRTRPRTAAIDRRGPDLAPLLTGIVGRYVLPLRFSTLYARCQRAKRDSPTRCKAYSPSNRFIRSMSLEAISTAGRDVGWSRPCLKSRRGIPNLRPPSCDGEIRETGRVRPTLVLRRTDKGRATRRDSSFVKTT
ncbi:MAG TPA: sugar phosphate nucleotidyltransferase [Casimicrobiaceae bacterium]|nr:sugar phosphate nucleotidyltransferase [Casimicrobiaceae bacterium]